MAKRSQRRPVRHERDQSGCIWGLISMLDFRQGRPTQKLISDRRRGSRHAAAEYTKKKLASLDENCQDTLNSEESSAAGTTDSGKSSVKKLMEEEMFSEQYINKETDNAEVEVAQSDSELGDQKKKNRKRTNRSRTRSCDIPLEDWNTIEDLESKRPSIQKSEKKPTKSLDIDEIMEEFCHQIHQKGISCVKHDHSDELHQPNQNSPDFDDKLREAIKFIIEKLINAKDMAEDENLHPSKEIRDALQILSSDEEFFMKILQGPRSRMVKYVQNLWNDQVEKDEDSKSLAGSTLSEQDLKQSHAVIPSKHRNFFRRKTKSGERNPSRGDQVSQTSNRIVILKPGPTCLQNPENDSSFGLSTDSQFIIRNNGPIERSGSHFFLAELKRKLKHAMGKDRQDISADGTSKRFPDKRQVLGDGSKGFKENRGRSSPNKDHFFIEKIAKPPMGVKKRGKSGKLNESEISTEHETANPPNQRLSNIYIEAKKHLSEILGNESGDADVSGREVPKTLGRILSLTEYNFSPIGSPGRDWEQSLVTAKMKLSALNKFQKQEDNVCDQGRTTSNLESQSSVSHDSTDSQPPEVPPNPNSNISTDLIHDKEADKTSCQVEDETTPEGDVELVKAIEIVIEEGRNGSDSLPESNISSIGCRDDQNGDMAGVADAEENSTCLKNDSYEESQPPSPLASPSTSPLAKKVDDLEGAAEIPDRPSPVSVLEPLFTEEDVSPASTRSQPAELPVQPLRIQFEERDCSASDPGIHTKACIDQEKEPVFEFVKAVLQASDLSWDEFYILSHSTEQLLDQSTILEVELFPNHLCSDKKLLFDCANEVLGDLYGDYLGCMPGLSYLKPTIRPVLDMKNAVSEVCGGIYWHLLPLPLPHSLDQIVKKDMVKAGTWMDLRFDAETIFVGIGEAIFDDLIEETLLSCVDDISESGNILNPSELKQNESGINL